MIVSDIQQNLANAKVHHGRRRRVRLVVKYGWKLRIDYCYIIYIYILWSIKWESLWTNHSPYISTKGFTLVHIVSLIEFDVSLHDTPWKNICESAMRCPKICRQSMTKPLTSGAHSLPFCGSDVDAVCGNCENPLWMVVISVDTIHKMAWFCDYLWHVRRISWWWSLPVGPRISSEIIAVFVEPFDWNGPAKRKDESRMGSLHSRPG